MLSISVSFRLTHQLSDCHTAIGRPRLVNVFDLPFVWHDLPTRLVVHRPLAAMDEVAHGTVNKHFGPKRDRSHFTGLTSQASHKCSVNCVGPHIQHLLICGTTCPSLRRAVAFVVGYHLLRNTRLEATTVVANPPGRMAATACTVTERQNSLQRGYFTNSYANRRRRLRWR